MFSCEFCKNFRNNLFPEHLPTTAPADFFVPTKVLFTDQNLFVFFFHLLLVFIVAIMVVRDAISSELIFLNDKENFMEERTSL